MTRILFNTHKNVSTYSSAVVMVRKDCCIKILIPSMIHQVNKNAYEGIRSKPGCRNLASFVSKVFLVFIVACHEKYSIVVTSFL